MRVIFQVSAYNERRYSKPWLAKITDWPVGQKPKLEFGCSIDPETAEIDVQEGRLVMYGQKDRSFKARGTRVCYGVVQADGSIKELSAKEAKDLFLERQANVVQLDERRVG